MPLRESSSISTTFKEISSDSVIGQHALGFLDDQLFSLEAAACTRLRFRIGVAINSFRSADWYDCLGREGMYVVFPEFNGISYPSYRMGEVEKAQYVIRGHESRHTATAMTAKYIDPAAIDLIQKSASARVTASFTLAWELMSGSEHVFRRAYLTLLYSMQDADAHNPTSSSQPSHEFAYVMFKMSHSYQWWCLPERRDCGRENVQ